MGKNCNNFIYIMNLVLVDEEIFKNVLLEVESLFKEDNEAFIFTRIFLLNYYL